MKRIILSSLILAATCVSSTTAFAQSSSFYGTPYSQRNSGSFNKGDNLLSFGLGFVNTYMNGISASGKYGFSIPSIYAKYEIGIMDEIGIGVRWSLGSGYYKYMNTRYSNFATGGTVAGYYHFNKLIPVQKLDVYAGAGFSTIYRSYVHNNGVNRDVRYNDLLLRPVFLVGARWYFSNSFSVYGESGYDGMSYSNFGITLRF